MDVEEIRTLTIRGKAEGLDPLSAAVEKVAGAQDSVTASSQEATRATLTLQEALDRQRQSWDMVARAAQGGKSYFEAAADQPSLLMQRMMGTSQIATDFNNYSLGQAAKSLEAYGGAAVVTSKQVKVSTNETVTLTRMTDEAGGSFTKFTQTLMAGNITLNGYGDAAKTAGQALQSAGTAASSAGGSIFGMSLPFTLVGAAAALAGLAVSQFGKASAEISKLGDRAQDLRMPADLLLALKDAAAGARVPVENVNTALDTLTTISKKAPDDAKEFYTALTNISPALAEAFKSAPTQAERLKIISDGLHQAKDEVSKYQLALQAFGTDNDRTIDLFGRGRDAIDEWVASNKRLGISIDGDAIAKVQKSQAQFDSFTALVKDRMTVAIVDLGLEVSRLSKTFATDAFSGFSDWVTGASGRLSSFRDVLRDLVYDFGLLTKAWDAIRNNKNLSEVWDPIRQVLGGGGGGVDAVSEDLKRTAARSGQEVGKVWSAAFKDAIGGGSGGSVGDALGVVGGLGKNKVYGNNDISPLDPIGPGAFKARPSLKEASETKDYWDRATDSIDKHSSSLRADALAVGQSEAAREGLRAEFKLLEAARQSDKDVTAAQIEQYTTLRASMSSQQAMTAAGIELNDKDAASFERLTARIRDAADANQRAQLGKSIEFGRNTAFLDQSDVAIAQQLKNVYPDVTAALNSAEAAQLRFNEAARTTSSTISQNLTTALADITMGTKTAGDAFRNLGLVVIRAIEEMIIKVTIVEPLMRQLQSTLKGGGGGFNLFGSGGGPAFPSGGYAGSPVGGAHGGAIVGAEATFSRYVHPAYFDDAPRFHGGGVAGDEVPIIARKGEGIFTPEQMKAMGGGVSVVTHVTVNMTGDGSGGADPAQIAAIQAGFKRTMEQVADERIVKNLRTGGMLDGRRGAGV